MANSSQSVPKRPVRGSTRVDSVFYYLSSSVSRRPRSFARYAAEDITKKQLALIRVFDHSRRPVHFQLRANLLKASSENFDLLLLFQHSCFQLLHFAMLFEKFVKQHRVHVIVAHAERFALLIANYQLWIHFRHFLSDQTKALCARRIAPVAESHRLEQQNRFAGLVNRL